MERKDKYLITGATGVIGSALVKRLSKEKVEIVCPIRSIEKAQTIFNPEVFSSVVWIEKPIEVFLRDLTDNFDFIIHCASPTASKFFIEHPVETLRFNIDTTSLILDYAMIRRPQGLVYLSSLESYGTILDDSEPVSEDMQGYVNPIESRSSYNIAKRTCECMCHAYADEYDVPVKIVRLTQTISPDISDSDMRVFAQFARQAAKGEDIELHTDGTSARQYIHINDAVDAIICVLHKGKSGEVYNVAREDSYISVRDMAKFVQDNFNPSGKVVCHLRDDMGYAPTTRLKLCTDKLEMLGWKAKYDLYDMFENIISQICIK